MGPKFNSNSRREASEEEEIESMEGRFHEDMDEKDEFRIFLWNMLKGMTKILGNIIQSVQGTREFIAKQLDAKDGEGSNIGS